jgi:hypothetical protein
MRRVLKAFCQVSGVLIINKKKGRKVYIHTGTYLHLFQTGDQFYYSETRL